LTDRIISPNSGACQVPLALLLTPKFVISLFERPLYCWFKHLFGGRGMKNGKEYIPALRSTLVTGKAESRNFESASERTISLIMMYDPALVEFKEQVQLFKQSKEGEGE
jgi:hypothetical protein